MKKLFLLPALFLIFTLGACQSTKQTPTNVINSVLEDHTTEPYFFPKGEYYTYRFTSDSEQDFDVLVLIETLAKQKIPVTDLWYKSGSRSCLPPGSEMAMQVIVEPVLFIRLEKPAEKMQSFGFSKSIQPDMGGCAYRVKRFRF